MISSSLIHFQSQQELTRTETNATTKAATSLSMWKLSATKAIEFVIYPTTISTKKKNVVRISMDSNKEEPAYEQNIIKYRPPKNNSRSINCNKHSFNLQNGLQLDKAMQKTAYALQPVKDLNHIHYHKHFDQIALCDATGPTSIST
ncbi:hypothetical protein HUJ04_010705 [Dendroctonus ponderosae]|nr:hypothetical protein HUJ04_010704 [Dendroctonus ponderosae]KAH1021156.1 hypothetical protein HUJ04_010705 [Dendroctonus ponderosae]